MLRPPPEAVRVAPGGLGAALPAVDVGGPPEVGVEDLDDAPDRAGEDNVARVLAVDHGVFLVLRFLDSKRYFKSSSNNKNK